MLPPSTSQLVSCLCVTRDRPAELARAISNFSSQTYPNKELVIVHEADDRATAELVAQLRQRSDIRALEVPVHSKLKLGALRNLAIEAANGEYICQWDDDDWCHARRLELQLQHLLNTEQDACLLTNWLVFDAVQQRAYLSHFRLWEGSLMCRKAALQDNVRYPSLSKMEDSFFVNQLIRRGRVVPLVAPQLYIYVLHGKNTWDKYHGRVLLASSQPLSDASSMLISEVLAGRYSAEEASLRVGSRELLAELNYFYVNTLTPTDEQLQHYLEAMDRIAGPPALRVAV